MQIVSYGITISGKQGLFTNGLMAWPFKCDGTFSVLDSRKWTDLTESEKTDWCLKQGFQYVPVEGVHYG